jgi:cystathionine beta-lyase/cystathionine gamma-synthase
MTQAKPRPHIPPLELSAVWECADPRQADAILGKQEAGYVYRREGHPNADALAQAVRTLHGTDFGVATSSGMGAIAAAILATVKAGDHVILSDRLYGKTTFLVTTELPRLGVEFTTVDMRDHSAVQSAARPNTKLLIAETIANPRLEVMDLAALAKLAHSAGALLLADNTFATPFLCRPAELGADLVMESLTKMINGHSDVLLGWIGGTQPLAARVASVVATWGLISNPLDCWLATRSLATFPLRMERCCENALSAAEFLAGRAEVSGVDYPGLANHPEHALAKRQFAGQYGPLITFHLRGGLAAAEAFIRGANQIPFCPSLGTFNTSLSHPASTSHRAYSAQAREQLGITEGTIRMSVGVEAFAALSEHLHAGFRAVSA